MEAVVLRALAGAGPALWRGGGAPAVTGAVAEGVARPHGACVPHLP